MNEDTDNQSITMRFDEFSLKDGVASSTGHAETTINIGYRQRFKRLRRTYFDDENKLLILLDTGMRTDTATVYTWKIDNLVLQSKLDILD